MFSLFLNVAFSNYGIFKQVDSVTGQSIKSHA